MGSGSALEACLQWCAYKSIFTLLLLNTVLLLCNCQFQLMPLTAARMEETIWSSSGYLDEDSARWSQVLQAPTDWSSPRASEPAKLKAAGYKWHYAVLCCKPENDDDYDDYDDHDELSLSTCQNVLPTTASNHCLHHLLEPDSSTSQMTLRTRGHSFNLPRFHFDLTKKSFIFRSLYSCI